MGGLRGELKGGPGAAGGSVFPTEADLHSQSPRPEAGRRRGAGSVGAILRGDTGHVREVLVGLGNVAESFSLGV